MAGKFSYMRFGDVELSDPFFDSLRADYPSFDKWFQSKIEEPVFVYQDDQGVGAFLYIKDKETEPIPTIDGELPACERTKIGTLKLDERMRGQRIGEGAVGLALWRWRKLKTSEIYLTVFPDHNDITGLIEKFGFSDVGVKSNGEHIFLRNRACVDYSNPNRAFPFLKPDFENAGYIIIENQFHDQLFPYSELKGAKPNNKDFLDKIGISAANGMTKYYLGSPFEMWPFKVGEPIFVYRKDNTPGPGRSYRSCITSIAVVTEISLVRDRGRSLMSEDEFVAYIKNKSVYDENELREKYRQPKLLVVLGMLYLNYFGAGNNVTMNWLREHGFWPECYPTNARLSHEQFEKIAFEGGINVSDIVID